MSDSWIMRNTGMDKNELLRFKQISGLAELFRDRSFGLSDEWLEEYYHHLTGPISNYSHIRG